MTRRRGVTLTEVLVAIFVTGLGLMALMTLFPIGALNMSQALKDDRTAHAAANANSYIRTWWRTQVTQGQSDPWFGAATGNGPSNPVYIDPIGFAITSGNPLPGGIQRVEAPTGWIANDAQKNANILRNFSLLDDYTFNKNGLVRAPGGVPEREGQYSWAYMVRRLRASDPRVLEYAIAVYQRRSLTLAASGGFTGEASFTATLNAGGTTVSVPDSAKVRKGGWIMDGTNGYFYRVRGINTGGGFHAITVENPFRAAGASVVCLQNVVEVFERSTLE